MIMNSDEHVTELRMNAAELYREETFTDRNVGTLRRLTPVTINGAPDNDRQVVYVGQAQVLTPVGALPLTFEINARSFAEAIEKYSEAAKVAFDHTVEELQELRREAASSIVLPQTGAGGLGVPGSFPGGGKIKLP